MKERQQEKIFTKDFISISLTQLLVFVVFYALLTTLPLYVTIELGESQASAGLVVTFMLISAIIVRLFAGKILDIFGQKKSLVASMILFAVSTLFYIWIVELIPLLVLRFIHGISFGIVTTAAGAIVANIVPESRRGAGMGYFAMSTNIAMVLGSFIGLTLIQYVSFHTMFAILIIFTIIGVLCTISVNVKEHNIVKEKTATKIKVSDFIETKAVPIGIVSALVGFAYASILSFVSVYAEHLNLSAAASYFFLVFAVVMIIFRPYLGRAFDEKGPKKVLIPSLIFFAIGIMALGFTTTATMLLIAAAIIGLGYGTLLPGFQTLSIQSTTNERSGYAISTFFVFYDIGIAAGSYVLGLVISGVGFGNMYLLTAILVLFTALILYRYLTKKEKAAIHLETTTQEAKQLM